MRFASVVLAAGKSQRMGRNKLLLRVAGRTILDRVLDAVNASNADETFVVLGHRPEELNHIVEAHGERVILNLDYEEGMTSSVKAGIRQVTADAAFMILGDQLGLSAELLNAMSNLMEADEETLIVSPVCDGKRGHPVLLRRALFDEILSLGEGQSLKDIVVRHETSHRVVEGDRWCVMDVDTPEDFQKAVQQWRDIERRTTCTSEK